MSRFYASKENINGNMITIGRDEAHHILDVMRLKIGDKVVVFDGTGTEYTGFIKHADTKNKKVIIEVVRTDRPLKETVPELILAQAIPKKGKMDYIVEKATELGVSRIIPIVSERTVVRPDEDSSRKKIERWKKIALETSKQCGRRDVPAIDDITEYSRVVYGMDEYDLGLMACLSEDRVSIKDALGELKTGRVLVFIGPEGDFTTEELRLADRDNCRFVSLGRRVLKSDTAGLFVLSTLAYEFSV